MYVYYVHMYMQIDQLRDKRIARETFHLFIYLKKNKDSINKDVGKERGDDEKDSS